MTNDNTIILTAKNITSLQALDQGQASWRVETGEVTVLLNDRLHTLRAGQEINVPQGSLFALANLSSQSAALMVNDNGTATVLAKPTAGVLVDVLSPVVQSSLSVYNSVVDMIAGTASSNIAA